MENAKAIEIPVTDKYGNVLEVGDEVAIYDPRGVYEQARGFISLLPDSDTLRYVFQGFNAGVYVRCGTDIPGWVETKRLAAVFPPANDPAHASELEQLRHKVAALQHVVTVLMDNLSGQARMLAGFVDGWCAKSAKALNEGDRHAMGFWSASACLSGDWALWAENLHDRAEKMLTEARTND